MLPGALKPESFRTYPPLARGIAEQRMELFRQLPLPFLALLLREMIAYDWKFPAERKDLDRQISYLGSLEPAKLKPAIAEFAQIRLSPALEQTDWVNEPGLFSERLTAHLWATHQIEGFRSAAVEFMNRVNAAASDEPKAAKRVGIAVIGQGVSSYNQPLFRKLRPHGTYFSNVKAVDGLSSLLKAVVKRAEASPSPFAHWYIDGGAGVDVSCAALTSVSYDALRTLRSGLQTRIQKAFESGMGAEALRTALARMRPEEFGLAGTGDQAVLNRFQVSIFTEGSGTQIFSTTFAQWAAREALRRAQPATMLVRFAPRQKERPMSELLTEAKQKPELDPEGSLRDADMGAYYTWLNLQRLPGSEQAGFLAWFEDHQQAVAIGPGLKPGTVSAEATSLAELGERIG